MEHSCVHLNLNLPFYLLLPRRDTRTPARLLCLSPSLCPLGTSHSRVALISTSKAYSYPILAEFLPRHPTSTPALPPGERLLQARRRHSRHPAGRSWCQCCRCQNPGEFPGPHGEEEDQKRRTWPEGPGPRGAWRSWGRPGRRGRLPQWRLGQVSKSFPSPGTR